VHGLMIKAFHLQAKIAESYGSEVNAELLSRIEADLGQDGPVARLVDDWEGHPIMDALPLRLLGAVHELVLTGKAPILSEFYPSVGGVFDSEPAWAAFLDTTEAHALWIRSRLDDQLQTNEVRRSAVLLGGFLEIAKCYPGLPFILYEIGASAGLNLFWDQYRYELGPYRWGNPDSDLVLRTDWKGSSPALSSTIEVAERKGCDLDPVDIRDEASRIRLQSFVWPDQVERLARLRAAIEIASRFPPELSREGADSWLQKCLQTPASEHVSVIFQSIMWMYVPESVRIRVTQQIEEAGLRARISAPLAWLRFEGDGLLEAELRLQCWPGGEDLVLARAHYHGDWVNWLSGDESTASSA
jgi:hypothetical protein